MADADTTILADPRRNGAYLFTGDIETVEQAAKAAGLTLVDLDLASVQNKAELLELLAERFGLPPYFGGNWDALYDSLTDLPSADARSWLILMRNAAGFASRHRRDFATALRVFTEAAKYWATQGKPFSLIVAGQPNWRPKLPELKAADFK
jgi:RNAse (barnase) inhibitor barstar